MENLPGPLLYQLLKYSNIRDVLILECLSTKIQAKLRGNVSGFQYGIEKIYRTDRKPFDECKQWLLQLKGKTVDLGFIPYYTTGGHYGSSWSLMNLISKDGKYCTQNRAGHNIIVKSINVADKFARKDFYARWKGSGDLIQHDEAMEADLEQLKDRAVINCLQCAWPTSGFTCPLKQVMFFLGDDSSEFPQIEKFFDTRDSEALTAAAKETGYSFTLHDEVHYEYAVFYQKSAKMQPAVWIAFKDSSYLSRVDNYAVVHLTRQIFVAKYMTVLLIDAHRARDGNIDVQLVLPAGFQLNQRITIYQYQVQKDLNDSKVEQKYNDGFK